MWTGIGLGCTSTSFRVPYPCHTDVVPAISFYNFSKIACVAVSYPYPYPYPYSYPYPCPCIRGIGVIARDDQGRVMAAMCKTLQVPLGALEIEAKAVEAAAIFPRDIGIQEVIFESDSLLVCSAIQGKTEASPAIAKIISGIFILHQHMNFFREFGNPLEH
ncbi:hypothetical protein SO802_009059 [Lithocarpus litseifolius]|uniref:RNase H type-1 domain-containing protein n=1 Tax=Lithocarpus litseifolius TaxID=425828 RepID=A0AAW2DAX5_9ROSI